MIPRALNRDRAGRGEQRGLQSLLGTFCLCLASANALADTTSLAIADASRGTSNVPVTLLFPTARSGDIGYDTVLTYHTVNGTAVAPLDYTAASGSIVIPAGSTDAGVPIALSAYPYGGPDRTFDLVFDGLSGVGPAPLFAAQQTFGGGAGPYHLVTVDINGDGKPDIVLANYNDGSVCVLLNTTAPGAALPSFAAQVSFAAGASPASVIATDINGDGKPDLVLTNNFNQTVSVLRNTTATGAMTPTFATLQTFATMFQPRDVATADINGDGKPDLIVTNLGSNSISVLLNTTARGAAMPSFAAQQTFVTDTNPATLTIADFNGDGLPDVATANNGGVTVSVLLNTTSRGAAVASFTPQIPFLAGQYPIAITAGDINHDGKPDLVVTNASGIAVLLNTTAPGAATPQFSALKSFATGPFPVAVKVRDLNGDGNLDLIVVNKGPSTIPDYGTVSVLLNATPAGSSEPYLLAQQQFATGQGSISVDDTDLNGDGKIDLVIANEDSNDVSVLIGITPLGPAALDYSQQQLFNTGGYPVAIATADINGDGKPDAIVANFTDGTVSALINRTGNGAAVPDFLSQQIFSVGATPNSVAVIDLNGDGKPDLVVANRDYASVSVLLNKTPPGTPAATFASVQSFAAGYWPAALISADVNGDGLQDLIVTNRYDNTVSVLLNSTVPGSATLSFAAPTPFATGGDAPVWVSAADLNGDGKPDLVIVNQFANSVSVLVNITPPGAVTPVFSPQQTFAGMPSPDAIAIADLNGDGVPDLAVASHLSDAIAVMLGTTAPGAAIASFAAPQTFNANSFLYALSIIAVDADGDGRQDLVVMNQEHSLFVLLNRTVPGASTFAFVSPPTYAAYAIGNNSTAVTAADVNGDGKPDFMVTNLDDSDISVLLNAQYQTSLDGTQATGTIVHDYIFADQFE